MALSPHQKGLFVQLLMQKLKTGQSAETNGQWITLAQMGHQDHPSLQGLGTITGEVVERQLESESKEDWSETVSSGPDRLLSSWPPRSYGSLHKTKPSTFQHVWEGVDES